MISFRKYFSKRLIIQLLPYLYGVVTLLILFLNDTLGDYEGFIVFSLLFFVSMAVLLVRWTIFQIKLILILKNEKSKAELLHLKSQVNPHFFFNTLNNLYGLVEQDSGKAQALILKLSDMMRYSIYEGQNDRVSLNDEIIYLENYIELHRMRYHKNIDILFTIDVADRAIQIMPLLFIILLENAFKHGVEKLRKDAFVHICLSATTQAIDFEIENNFDIEEVQDNKGIGLKNLRQRLELVYPNRYLLAYTANEMGRYKARLILKKI